MGASSARTAAAAWSARPSWTAPKIAFATTMARITAASSSSPMASEIAAAPTSSRTIELRTGARRARAATAPARCGARLGPSESSRLAASASLRPCASTSTLQLPRRPPARGRAPCGRRPAVTGRAACALPAGPRPQGDRRGPPRWSRPRRGRRGSREVAAGDLGRRPPQGVGHDLTLAPTACDRVAQEAVVTAGEQHAAQHRPERLGLDRRADRGGDHLGHGVGLLGREAALLDREAGAVAGGVDVRRPRDTPMRVDRDESVGVRGDALEPRPEQRRQRDHAVGVDPPPPGSATT